MSKTDVNTVNIFGNQYSPVLLFTYSSFSLNLLWVYAHIHIPLLMLHSSVNNNNQRYTQHGLLTYVAIDYAAEQTVLTEQKKNIFLLVMHRQYKATLHLKWQVVWETLRKWHFHLYVHGFCFSTLKGITHFEYENDFIIFMKRLCFCLILEERGNFPPYYPCYPSEPANSICTIRQTQITMPTTTCIVYFSKEIQ